MAKAFDGSIVPSVIDAPCGEKAYFDGEYSYRCGTCFAVLGSMGMPEDCRELMEDE